MRWSPLACLFFLPLILVFTASGGVVEEGLGSRTWARGGTCVAWPDETTTGSCNPAGPAMLEGIHVLVGLAPKVNPSVGEIKLLSSSWQGGLLALSGALALSSKGDEAEELWAGSLALRARERVSLGIGVKWYHKTAEGAKDSGMSLDLGVLFGPIPALLLGFNFTNPVRGEVPSAMTLTRIGAQLELRWLRGAGELALSSTDPPRASWGAELTLLAPLFVRLGRYADGRWSGGLGFDSGRLNADFALLPAEAGLVWMLSTEVILPG